MADQPQHNTQEQYSKEYMDEVGVKKCLCVSVISDSMAFSKRHNTIRCKADPADTKNNECY